MKRRDYLSAVGASIVLTGCTTVLGANTNSPDSETALDITPPERLTPGGEGRIKITARDATTLRVSDGPNVTESLVRFSTAEFSVPPQTTYTVQPPTWLWETPQTVSVELPVTVPETVSPGAYHYTITLEQGDATESVTEQFTLTVSD